MESHTPTVFIVEDDLDTQKTYTEALGSLVRIITATSIEEAERKWEQYKLIITLVVMDGCVQSHTLNTPPLVQKIRETFDGPILAASSSKHYRDVLMQCGCTHSPERKQFVPALVLEILNSKQ